MTSNKTMKAKYKHTNIVAGDWRKLAGFYRHVFGCEPIPPERADIGEWVERCTGVNSTSNGIELAVERVDSDWALERIK